MCKSPILTLTVPGHFNRKILQSKFEPYVHSIRHCGMFVFATYGRTQSHWNAPHTAVGANGLPDSVKILFLLVIVGLFWWFNRNAKKWLKQRGRLESPPTRLDGLVPEQKTPPTTLKYSEQEFQEMVANALDEVPEEFDKEWKNVAVIVSTDWPSEADKKTMRIPEGHLLLGTYSGFDRTRGLQSEHSRHLIVVYQPAIEALCGGDKERVEQQIRKTVQHELAHHLGISHNKMKEIGLY